MTDIITTTSSGQNGSASPAKKDFQENTSDIQELFECLNQTGPLVIGPVARCSTLPGIIGASLPKVSSESQDAIKRAKKYAMKESVKMVLMKQTLAHQQNQMASQRNQVQRQQALALMCRIYVGSISFELREDAVREAFMPFGPIKSINMSWDIVTQKHKGFAFVEYDIPEAAQLALDQMNGVMIGGRNIKVVGRPSNMPQAQSIIDNIIEESRHYNRIYISSIHRNIEENDIKLVFEAFGPIKYCQLFRGSSANRERSYAYIEYQTMQSAVEAISSMNLFDLGGVCLRVGIAITPPNVLMEPSSGSSTMPTATAFAAATATAKIQAMDAVASNAVTLGLTKMRDSDSNFSDIPRSSLSPTAASVAPVIPPPGVVIPQMLSQPPMSTQYLPGQTVIIPPPAVVAPTAIGTLVMPIPNPASVDATKRAQEQAHQKQQEELQKKLLEETEVQTLQQQENLTIKGPSARHLVMQKLMRRIESRVIVLRNMTTPEDVDEELENEIKEECLKYGTVNKVVIYNERQSEDDDAEIIVKIFVEFLSMSEAERAKDSLNGRYFNKRLVKCEFYDQSLYDFSDYSG